MTLDQINNEIQILETLLPNSRGTEWMLRDEKLTMLKKKLEKIKDQPKHQFTSSLYREKTDHSIEQHPMESVLFGLIGIAGIY